MSVNIHEWGKNLRGVGGNERGGLYFLPENLFLAPSLPLCRGPCKGGLNLATGRHKRDTETEIETNLWQRGAAQRARLQHREDGRERWSTRHKTKSLPPRG